MTIDELRTLTAKAIGKDPATVGDDPEWDSLDRLEIVTRIHDEFGEAASEVEDLESFTTFSDLADRLRGSGLVD